MSSFQEKLDEFYLNYDTASILKEDSKTNDIVNMFKTELDYPEILTTAILKFPKTFLKSVVMRIKVSLNKVENSELKNDLLKYNHDLEPILDKLLSENYNAPHVEVVKVKVKEPRVRPKPKAKAKLLEQIKVVEEVEEVDEDGEEAVEEAAAVEEVDEDGEEAVEEAAAVEEVDEDGEEAVEEAAVEVAVVEEAAVEVVEEDQLSDDQVVERFLQGNITESAKNMVSLVDMYESYEMFCKKHNYETMIPSPFKKSLKIKMGKPEGKGDKSIYKGYKLSSI